MATNNGSGIAASNLMVKSNFYWWGEVYAGTKEALQDIGIGIGQQFPATSRSTLRVLDPRGLPCEVSLSYLGDGTYSARVRYPERARPDRTMQYAPGVKKEDCTTYDRYVGTDADLIAAGLVHAHQLPGSFGRQKTRVALKPGDSDSTACVGGDVVINKTGKNRFEVLFYAEGPVRDARLAIEKAWELRWCDAARPRSLTWRAEMAKRQALAEQEEVASIRKLPATKDAYRESVASTFLSFAEKCIECMKPQYGYRYEEDDIKEFRQAVGDLYWALKEGAVIGLGPNGELQRVMTARAKNNEPLQAFLSSVKAKS